MEIPGLSSANQALSLVGSIADLVKKGATIELQTMIVGLKEAVLALKEENLNLKERVNELERGQSQKDALVFEYPNYYSISNDGSKDGPFCQVCQDTINNLVRLKEQEIGSWLCGGCNQHFETSEHKRRSAEEWDSFNRQLSERNNNRVF